MLFRVCVVGVATASLMTFALLCQAAPAHYYRWQGDSRIVCAQTARGRLDPPERSLCQI